MEAKRYRKILLILAIFTLVGFNISSNFTQNESKSKLHPFCVLNFADAYAARASVSMGFCGGVICECPLTAFYCVGNNSFFYRDGICGAGCEVHLSGYTWYDSASCYSSSRPC
jgi:hypothetical protein